MQMKEKHPINYFHLQSFEKLSFMSNSWLDSNILVSDICFSIELAPALLGTTALYATKKLSCESWVPPK